MRKLCKKFDCKQFISRCWECEFYLVFSGNFLVCFSLFMMITTLLPSLPPTISFALCFIKILFVTCTNLTRKHHTSA